MIKVSKEAFLAIGKELFGEDPKLWRFRCAHCGHEQSMAEARERNPSLSERWSPHFSCEGRETPGVGCDWTLGGLLLIHTIEVYDEHGRAQPSFEFAHPYARAKLDASAASFAPPVHLTTDAKTWAEFTWPEWVPDSLRSAIEEFWREDWGRGPQAWCKDQKNQGAPTFGSVTTLRGVKNDETGRFVHCWNNIGRVVKDDGSVAFVSF